ncbi:GGDEF domain-containing protein [Alteromonas sediminis]|uniref:GGDEF domain-containing protein n=1 Tax=Alteromonas sediminis TaxID=2259342 RepID=UPI001404F5EA|nr:GGDEF domain-containing protein [Alteromonas sediminis]
MDTYTASHFENTAPEAVLPFHSNTIADDVSLINQVLLHLIKTIDIEELITTYYQQIKRFLPLTAISLRCAEIDLFRGAHSTGAKNPASVTLPSPVKTGKSAHSPTLYYWFSRDLSAGEQQLTKKLHGVFCHPLDHALHLGRLASLATRDSLTGLGNRASFDEDICNKLSAVKRKDSAFALVMFDLDNFKSVNDNFGHETGDLVLSEAAACIACALRANDKAYRFGGDEFCCIVDTFNSATVDRIAQRISGKFDKSVLLSKHAVTVSIGASISMPDDSPIDLFRRADEALYNVKKQGKYGYQMA